MPQKRTRTIATCEQCGKSFTPVHASVGRFCSPACFGKHRTRPLLDRFWERVDRTDGCWMWTGPTTKAGYGIIRSAGGRNGTTLYVHRLSYEIHHGPIDDGLVVMHACDNPRCVNPSHLSIGTHGENHADMISKARHPHGEAAPWSRLSEDDIRTIRDLHASGITQADIAHRFGVDRSHVSNIVHRKRWVHID